MRFVLKVSYDGTDFAGWQIQPQKRTVQGELERAAAEIFGRPVSVQGSGRTDSGVHALGQICQFDAETGIPAPKLRECFNARLAPDVRILSGAQAPEDFDCIRNAKKKTYRYRFYCAPCELPLISRYGAWVRFQPKIDAMEREAKLIEGEHDFCAFCASGSSAKTTVRTVYSVAVSQTPCYGGSMYDITVCGNGFLYNMVRIIAGHLLAVGCGQREEGSVLTAFKTGERGLLGKTMPPHGLTMVGVDYGFELFDGRED